MEKVYAKDREAWRTWLEKNHDSVKEIWLAYYKKHTGKPSVSYKESVEEALCFGWIDGILKRIDDEVYVHRFTPRKAKSKWSLVNIKSVEKLKKEGRMTEAGLSAFNKREKLSKEILEARAAKEILLTPEIEKVLRENKKAWENYNNLAPSYRKQYAGWIMSAKREETREKRLKEVIILLENNEKPGMR